MTPICTRHHVKVEGSFTSSSENSVDYVATAAWEFSQKISALFSNVIARRHRCRLPASHSKGRRLHLLIGQMFALMRKEQLQNLCPLTWVASVCGGGRRSRPVHLWTVFVRGVAYCVISSYIDEDNYFRDLLTISVYKLRPDSHQQYVH